MLHEPSGYIQHWDVDLKSIFHLSDSNILDNG